MAGDGSVIIDIIGDASKFKAALGKLGSIASGALKGVGVAVGAATTAIGGLAVGSAKVGAEFEQVMADTSTMFGDVAVDAEGLNDKILTLSSETGMAAADIGKSLYNALSAGIPVTEDMGAAMEYMEANVKLAKAGFTDVDTAVTATAKVLNAYKMDVSETDKVHKVLMQTQNKGITTVGELGASLAQVTPTAAAMNVSFEQVGASLATMTAQGTPTAQATTQLNSLLAELGKSGTKASGILKEKTGKSFKELMREGYDLSQVLSLMQTDLSSNAKAIADLMSTADAATGKTMTFEEACSELGLSSDDVSGELIDMFGSIEAGKAALAMSGQNAQQFTDNLAAMSTEADVVGDAYTKVTDTLQAKTEQLKESFKNLGIAAYDGMETPLKEAATTAIDMVGQIAQAFQEGGLTGAVEAVGSVFAQLATEAAKAAPQMIDAAISLIQSFLTGITDNLPALSEGAVKIVVSLVSGIANLLPQFADAAVKLIAALVSGIGDALPTLVPVAVEAIATLVKGLQENTPMLIEAALHLIEGLAQGLLAALPVLLEATPEIITGMVRSLLESIPVIIQTGIDLLTSIVDGLPEIIDGIVEEIPAIIEGILQALMENAMPMAEAGVKLFVALVTNLPKIILELVKAIPEIIKALVKAFMDAIPQMIEVGIQLLGGIGKGIYEAVSSVIDAIKNALGKIVDAAKNLLGIHSPSRVFAEIGNNTMLGFAGGVKSGAQHGKGEIVSAFQALTDGLMDARRAAALGSDVGTQFAAGFSDGLDGLYVRMQDAVALETQRIGADISVRGTAAEYAAAARKEDATAPQPGKASKLDVVTRLEVDPPEFARAIRPYSAEEERRRGMTLVKR